MRFTFEQTDADDIKFCGDVSVISESLADTEGIIGGSHGYFERQTSEIDKARILIASEGGDHPTYVYRSPSGFRNSQSYWFQFESCLDYDFTQPYQDLLERLTGCETDLATVDIDLTPFLTKRLRHTHIVDRIWINNGHICFLGYDSASEWNKKDPFTNAEYSIVDNVGEDCGKRQHEPEHITKGNRIIRNPDYLKRHPASPAVNGWLWAAIVAWWRENGANAEQLEILDASTKLTKTNPLVKSSYVGGFSCYDHSIYYPNKNGECNWDSKGTKVAVMNWKEFAAIK